MDERCSFGSLWSASLAARVRRRAYDVLLLSYVAPIEHRRERQTLHCTQSLWSRNMERGRRKEENRENREHTQAYFSSLSLFLAPFAEMQLSLTGLWRSTGTGMEKRGGEAGQRRGRGRAQLALKRSQP